MTGPQGSWRTMNRLNYTTLRPQMRLGPTSVFSYSCLAYYHTHSSFFCNLWVGWAFLVMPCSSTFMASCWFPCCSRQLAYASYKAACWVPISWVNMCWNMIGGSLLRLACSCIWGRGRLGPLMIPNKYYARQTILLVL